MTLPSYTIDADLSIARQELANARERLARATDPVIRAEIEAFIADTERRIESLSQQLAASQRASAGEEATSAENARSSGGLTQNPPTGPQTINAQGQVSNAPATTTPSNATPAQTNIGAAPGSTSPAPSALPAGTVNVGGATVGNQTSSAPLPATQVADRNVSSLTPPGAQTTDSLIYRAYEVTSFFSKGQFTQEIQGAQVFFDVPKNTLPDANRNAAATAGAATDANRPAADLGLSFPIKTPQISLGTYNNLPSVFDAITLNRDNTTLTPDEINRLGLAKVFPATSGGQPVAATTTQQSTSAGSVTVTLSNGSTLSVTNPTEVINLYNQGSIGFVEANSAITRLQSQQTAGQAAANIRSQLTVKE